VTSRACLLLFSTVASRIFAVIEVLLHRRVSKCLCAVLQKLPATRIHITPHLLSVSVAVGIVVPESLCRPISAISAALSHRIHHFNSKPTSFLRVSSFPLLGRANSVCSKLLSSCLSSASSPGNLPTSFLLASSPTPHVRSHIWTNNPMPIPFFHGSLISSSTHPHISLSSTRLQ
jgi:hypothetical protein